MRWWWTVLHHCIPPSPVWLFIYLSVPGLCCGMWDLWGSLLEACKHLAVACVSSLIGDQTQPPPLDWGHWVLATGPPGKSPLTLFWSMISPTLSFGILNRSIREEGLPGGVVVKNIPANARDIRDAGSIPGLGRSLEEEMATHSSILTWKIPWTEEPVSHQKLGEKYGIDSSSHPSKETILPTFHLWLLASKIVRK